MSTTIQESSVLLKTRELCQAILDEPNMADVRRRVDAFMSNERARADYELVMNKGEALDQKQQSSVPLTGEEIADFELHRDRLMKNPVARDFVDAQEQLQKVQSSIHKYVSKTLELGRVPTEEDLSEGSCGHGCGCHH
jgi:cell fate (sporulation/competence/biofilm development) regulator YlbF (YheA/YmcA/DUF963 family)